MKKGLTILSAFATVIFISSNLLVSAAQKPENETKQKQEVKSEKETNKSSKGDQVSISNSNKFSGKVEKMAVNETGTWTIKGRQVIVNDKTKLEGEIKVGSYVKVKGKFTGKTFIAKEIELKEEKEE